MIYKIGSAVVNMYNVKAVEPVYDFDYSNLPFFPLTLISHKHLFYVLCE